MLYTCMQGVSVQEANRAKQECKLHIESNKK